MTEEQMMKRVEELDQQLIKDRQRVSDLKKQLMNVETDLIGHNLERTKLLEQLRVYRNEHYHPEITDRQREIDRFKALLPELIKKIE